MQRLSLQLAATVFAATTALAAPVSAQSLSVLLPQITFPDPVTAPSTKGCAPQAQDCHRQE